MSRSHKHDVIIIGAGPAGLTAGVEIRERSKKQVTILERDDCVGGLARTVDYKGYKFDFGPHHFITEAPHIEAWWKKLMGKDFIKHKRFTRIYYKKRYFHYPLDALNVIWGLSLVECVRCVASYVKARLFPIKNVVSFEDWITNKFGYRLFSIFFKTYTEKVWGISCDKISSDWAAQRIKGFSLSKAIFYAFFGRFFKKNAPRTLSDTFYYPPKGAGMLWDRVARRYTDDLDGSLQLSRDVSIIEHDGGSIRAVVASDCVTGVQHRYEARHFFSTMPLKTLIESLSPAAPQGVISAAKALSYRGLLTVNLIINKAYMFPDHWLYVHDKDVRMGRIGNMSNFSDQMAADPSNTALSLEYFTYVEDEFWSRPDEYLVELGKKELHMLGIAKADDVLDGMVLRAPEAYPVYDEHYQEHLGMVLEYLKSFNNLYLMGRNGLHRYNNMDHAMLSAFDAVKRLEASLDMPSFMGAVKGHRGSREHTQTPS